MMNRQKIRGGYYVTLDFPKTGPPNLLDEPIVVVAGIVRQKGESYVLIYWKKNCSETRWCMGYQ